MKMKLITTILISSLVSVSAQEKKEDPFKKDAALAPASKDAIANAKTYTINHEMFSLSMNDAAKLQRRDLSDAEAYKYLIDNAKLENLTVLRVLSGQRAETQGTQEFIYPTEYEPAELPSTVGVSIVPPTGKDVPQAAPEAGKLQNAPNVEHLSALKTPSTGTAFETRNLGTNTSAFITPLKNGMIHLSLRMEICKHVGNTTWGQGVSKIEMPLIESQMLKSSVSLELGKPLMLGTMNVYKEAKEKGDSPDQVWFAIVTVKPVKK